MPLTTGPEEFRAFNVPGYAKAAVNFRVTSDASESGTWLSTETRIATTDPGARCKFRAYWLLIRPGSALIRREWLAAIKRRAEGREEGEATRASTQRHGGGRGAGLSGGA